MSKFSKQTNKLPCIEVNISKRKVSIDGGNVNYSFGSLHHVFRKAIRYNSKEISQAKSALILGFGAGSIAKILWNEKNYPIQITGVDFEPLMFELAKKYSGINDFDQLDLITADALEYMASCTETFDVIFIDLFVEDQIPELCLTASFLSNVKNCLNKEGLVIWNTLVQNNLETQIKVLAKAAGFRSFESKGLTKDNLVLSMDQKT